MARFLFVVPPLQGHLNPTVAVGAELAGRGHQVAWCGFRPFLEPLLPGGSRIEEVGDRDAGALIAAAEDRSQGLRGAAALKFFWEEFLTPLAHAMVPGVERAVDRFGPDALVVDQQTVAGALVARERHLPWATSATTSAELVDPFAALPKLKEWSDGCLVAFQRAYGVPAGVATAERLRFSEHLVLAFTTPTLCGMDDAPAHWQFVGPAFGSRPADVGPFPWERLDGDLPLVLVSLGTVNAASGERFYRVVAEAVADRPVQVVLATPPERVGPMPSNVVVVGRMPQVELLGRAAAMVTHGGHNSVCEALARGVPLVVAPIRDDQPVVADQVVASGSGLRVKFGRVNPAVLGAALDRILGEEAFRRGAARVADSFAAAGGSPAAADHLEKLVVG